MTVAVYPPELNQYWTISGFQTSRVDRRIKAQPSRGRNWQRGGQSLVGGRPLQASTIEPIGNVARFWRFHDEELLGGTLPFTVRDQQIDGLTLTNDEGAPQTDETGAPLLLSSLWLVQFQNSSPEVPISDAYWQINFDILVLSP